MILSDAKKGGILVGGLLVTGIAVGLGIGWKLWSPKPMKPEIYAPAIQQRDGSVVLERKPQPNVKPAQQLPKGAKVERIVQVTVKPNPPVDPVLPRPSESGASVGDRLSPTQPERPPCPPVRVDLSLVRMPDLTRRVIASSPDGEVVGGVDIPVEPAREQKQLKWAAGLEYSVNQWARSRSIVVERDMAFLRVGGSVGQVTLTPPSGGALNGVQAGVRVMIRF